MHSLLRAAVSALAVITLLIPHYALALDSATYSIPQFELPGFGNEAESNNYQLRNSGGAISGVASSTNFGLDTGFPSVTGSVISLTLDSGSVDLGALNPGTPITGTTTSTVRTDSSAGYTIAIQKAALMRHSDAVTTIPDWTGTIATPTTFTGVGLGFTISAGTSVDSKWSSGTKFAAIPTGTPSVFHSVISSISTGNTTTVTYTLDSVASQKVGSYATSVAYRATALP